MNTPLKKRYRQSALLLRRALETIPLASQTFSKSKVFYPEGASPLFVERAAGSRLWDVDGNEYIDFVSGLGAILLGYNIAEVTGAVHKQLQNGVTFTLPHKLEMEVAELLVDMIPCAEMVRFGKNGSDATAAAMRLARAFTGRDHIAVCGYHGWHDWYIGSTSRHLGVPEDVRALTHTFSYNDADSLAQIFSSRPNRIAAVILEPMSSTPPRAGFLEKVREMTHEHGALLVFDEIVTGFRMAAGGAQEFFGVTPDLATVGKGMGNGFPVSAVVGRADIMRWMEDIFFSGTFGGETISLAASKAVLEAVRRDKVPEALRQRGEMLAGELESLLHKHRVREIFRCDGYPAQVCLNATDAGGCTAWEIRTLFMQETCARGILTLGAHTLSHAHSDDDIRKLLDVYDEILPLIRDAVRDRRLHEILQAEPLKPLFQVRQ